MGSGEKNIQTNYFLVRGPIPTTTLWEIGLILPVPRMGNRVNFYFKFQDSNLDAAMCQYNFFSATATYMELQPHIYGGAAATYIGAAATYMV